MLLGIAFGGWKIVIWMQPKIDMIINKHIEIIDATKATAQESLEIQRENQIIARGQTEIMTKFVNGATDSVRIAEEHRRTTSEIRDAVKQIKGAVVPDNRGL